MFRSDQYTQLPEVSRGAGRVRVGVLGPLTLWGRGSGSMQFLKGREARLLAALAVNAGGPVWHSQLIDAVWGWELPKSPQAALHNVVYRLRKEMLTAGLGDAVTEQGTGYMLTLSPSAVDAQRFEYLVAMAASSDIDVAPALLRRALSLWRGMALEGVAGASTYLMAASQRLENLRMSAFERRCELELSVGLYREVISELQAMTAEHPWSERLHGLLMVALYQAGRQSDALRLFHSLRQRLADEQGLSPGAAISDLELSILNHDVGTMSSLVGSAG